MSAKSTNFGSSKFRRNRSTAAKEVLSQQSIPDIDFASSSSPLSPGWVSGSNAVFLTPHSPSPRRPNTRSRRSSVYVDKPATSGVAKSKIPQNTNNRRRGFKIPALPVVFSPGGVKTRARRSSIYQTSTSRFTTVSTVSVRETRMFEQEAITVSYPELTTYQSPTQSSLKKQRSPVFSPLKMSKKINIPISPLIKQDRNVKSSKRLAPRSSKSVAPKIRKEVKADSKPVEKVSLTDITPKNSPAKSASKKRQARKQSPKTETASMSLTSPEHRTNVSPGKSPKRKSPEKSSSFNSTESSQNGTKSPKSTPRRRANIADKKTKDVVETEEDSMDGEMMDTDSDSIDDEIIFTPQKHGGTSDSSTTASSNSTSTWTVTKHKTPPASLPSAKKQRKTTSIKTTPKVGTLKSKTPKSATPRQKTPKSSTQQQKITKSISPAAKSTPLHPKTSESSTTPRKTRKSTTPQKKTPNTTTPQQKTPKPTTPLLKTPKSTPSRSTAAKSSSSQTNRSKSSTPNKKMSTSKSPKFTSPKQDFHTPKLSTVSQREPNSFLSKSPLHKLPRDPVNVRRSPPTPRHLVVKKPVTLQKMVLMKNTPSLESPKRVTKRKSHLDSEDDYSSPRLMFEDLLQRRDNSPFGTPSTPGIFESSRKKPRRESNEMYKIITPLKNRTNNSLIRTLGSSAYSASDSIADISDVGTIESSSTYTYNYSDRLNIDNDNRKWCTIL